VLSLSAVAVMVVVEVPSAGIWMGSAVTVGGRWKAGVAVTVTEAFGLPLYVPPNARDAGSPQSRTRTVVRIRI